MSWLKIAVVGGVNLDVLGVPSGEFKMRDSNIGTVRFSCGGVGHNIAGRIVRTGADVSLFTVVGNDSNAEWLKQQCLGEGIRIDHSVTVAEPSSVYLAIHGEDGDMLSAVNDMHLLDSFTPELVDQMLSSIDQSDACAVDANLPEQTLVRLAEKADVPLVCDPVSTVKAARIFPILPRLAALKPNLLEARALTGCVSPEDCAAHLLGSGVKSVFISLGKEGLYFADEKERGYLFPSTVTLRPQTGAGDALTAGITAGVALHEPVRECAIFGMEMAARFFKI